MISEADMRKTGKKMLKHKITYAILTGMCIGMMALTAGCGGQEQPASSDAAQLAEPGTGEETVAESETEEETDRGDVYVHSGENELVKVYFLDDIRYTLEEITDDGGNVTKKEADFSDIREGDMLHLKGREAVSDISGDEFLSSEVIITRVV